MHGNSEIKDDTLFIDIEDLPSNYNTDEEYVIAISGSVFETMWKLRNKYKETNNEAFKIYYDTFRIILNNGYIFARMSPEHKTILVESLREEQFIVCMCGDGANDCGALRAADVGVSLSTEEASIAAPFTSNVADISCLIKLFIEGKASLVTSINCFKYMTMYSIIQFLTINILASLNSKLNNSQYLISDLFITFPITILLAK